MAQCVGTGVDVMVDVASMTDLTGFITNVSRRITDVAIRKAISSGFLGCLTDFTGSQSDAVIMSCLTDGTGCVTCVGVYTARSAGSTVTTGWAGRIARDTV